MRDHERWIALAILAASSPFAAGDAAADARDPTSWSLLRHEVSRVAMAPASRASAQLVLDDGSRDVDVGFSAAAAFQFLWFNRFTPPDPGDLLDLEEILVLFPPGPEVMVGAAIQLVVFIDPDGDPSNGADFVAAFDDAIEVADGTSFSVYPFDPPLRLAPGAGDLLVGVVNRFVTHGVSPPSRPAALDTTVSAGRSWFAQWTTAPPDPPLLPSDDVLDLIDVVEPGNWMIRASVSAVPPVPVTEIPALGGLGLAALATLLALAAAARLRR